MSSERQIESTTSVRQALWEAHMKSPTAALEEVLGRTEVGAGRLSPPPQVEAKRERPSCDFRARRGALICFCVSFTLCAWVSRLWCP